MQCGCDLRHGCGSAAELDGAACVDIDGIVGKRSAAGQNRARRNDLALLLTCDSAVHEKEKQTEKHDVDELEHPISRSLGEHSSKSHRRHLMTVMAASFEVRARSRTVTRSCTSVDELRTTAPRRAPFSLTSFSLGTSSSRVVAIPLILIRGPLDTLMMTPGTPALRMSPVVVDPAAAEPDELDPPASKSVPNLVKVDDNMKNMSRRNTTSTSGTSGRGRRIRAGASMRMRLPLSGEGRHLIEIPQLIFGDPLSEETGDRHFNDGALIFDATLEPRSGGRENDRYRKSEGSR